MRDLCDGNGSLLLPVLQASSMLCLAESLQVNNKMMCLCAPRSMMRNCL